MNRYQPHALAITSMSLALLAAVPARAASVTKVSPQSAWGASGVPSYVTMYIYVPDTLAPKPPVLAAHHSCGTPVDGYKNSITKILAGADQHGFIVILPEATGRNCWDVGDPKSLTHDGGGDTQAVVQMVKHVIQTYDADPKRVYAMGGSSGAMMTQALMAVYPDVFRAGSARAGVAAGCWADGYASSNQWSNNCAGGNTSKSAEQWGTQARGMFTGYTGHRPRIQLFHGKSDTTINYKNLAESIKQWTNVLGVATMPSSTDSKTTSVSTYTRQYWQNACGYNVLEAWAGNGTHSMAYEEDDILAFFGLDTAGGVNPEPECPADGGTGGLGGTSGAGGMGGANGGGMTAGGVGPVAGGGGAPSSGGGGNGGRGGNDGSAGSTGTAGVAAGGRGGIPSGGGSPSAAVGGSGALGGMTAVGGSSTSGGSGRPGSGGIASSGAAGSGAQGEPSEPEAESGGCGCVVGEAKTKHSWAALLAMGISLLTFRRRGRRLESSTRR